MKKVCQRVITIATHPGSFHADDVFAVAALRLYLNIINAGNNYTIKIVRTRDPKEMYEADYRIDVGSEYDPNHGDFDHHQDLPKRLNCVPYAAFGLIWHNCGKTLCGGSKEIADFIEKKLVYPVDAQDNDSAGNALFEIGVGQFISAFTISDLIGIYNPLWTEDVSEDEAFDHQVAFAEDFLRRFIAYAKAAVHAKIKLKDAIEQANAQYIVLEDDIPWEEIIGDFSTTGLLYVVYQRKNGRWQIKCIEDDHKHRKSLPEHWAGLEGDRFIKVTGVEDAVHCHKKRFTCVALSKEGALKLVELAIAN